MEQSSARRASFLIMAVFALQPAVLGGWLALIPNVQVDLGLSKAELALALMGLPLALLPTLRLASNVASRYGPRHVIRAAFPAQSVAIMLPLLAWNGPSLFCALAIVGFSIAFTEIAMNLYAGRVEKRLGLTIMNRCHGFWATGLMGGSAFIALQPDLTGWVGLAVLSVASGSAGVMASHGLPWLKDSQHAQVAKRSIRNVPRLLVPVAALMFAVTLAEGAMSDWSAIYLASLRGGTLEGAGVSVTIFAGFMACGRFVGDWQKRVLGPVRMSRLYGTLAVAGVALLVSPLPLVFAYAGFALAGFGVASAYPLGVSAAAMVEDDYEAQNIAFVDIIALSGFVIGPPLFGLVAEVTSLRLALTLMLPGLILAVWLARFLDPALLLSSGGRAAGILRRPADDSPRESL